MSKRTSTFEEDLAAAIAASKSLRDTAIDRITSDVQDHHPTLSWDDLQPHLDQKLADAGLQHYSQTRRGESLAFAH
ncbi:hypothetical protein [Subtercola sp. YIM 133946]|uniref:hypothetical protein n=1 Tax=Subtercola sp. YIM 133946 TaxID=3118909 RepID=UPI002F929353